MTFIKFFRLCLVAAVLVCATFAFSQSAGQSSGSVQNFIANLPSGYTAVEGSPINLDTGRMCCEGYIPTALFFNKSAPYVAFSVQNMYSPDPMFRELPVFQLRPDEAIVVIGVTPPPAKFFSYMPYLLTRTYPPETTPRPLFASLGDAINVSTIKTLGPDPFSRAVVLIFTPDRGTDARLRAALRRAGYPDAIINTLPFPVPILQLGVDKAGDPLRSDVFLIVNRMARFDDKDAGKAYVDAMSNTDVSKRPLRVFRVTPAAGGALNPFPVQPLRVRGTGQSEMHLAPDLERLRQAILNTYKDRYNYTEYHTKFVAYEGYEYIERRKDTLGDNRDSLYFGAGYLPLWDLEDELTLGPNDVLVAYGPKHVATGKATYTNINVYASDQVMLSLAAAYDDSFGGSAEQYLGHHDPAAGLLYVQKFAYPGGCSGNHCLPLEVPPGKNGGPCTPWCDPDPQKTCPSFILDSSAKLAVYFRNYLEPPTRVGAAAGELLYDQVIKFSPK
jgi:hypothetical protein